MKEIKLVSKTKKEYIRELLNDYLTELSSFDKDIQFDEKGKPIYQWFDNYWKDADRFPFMIKIGHKIAGFALIRELSPKAYEMAEFYIKPEFRGDGNARMLASFIINLFDGNFEWSTARSNTAAISFWNKLIKSFGGGLVYEEGERVNWKLER